MERENKTLTTPEGKELVLKTYLTARERNALRDIFLKSAKLNIGNNEAQTTNGMDIDGTVLSESQNKLIETSVIRYGEITDPTAILNALLDGKPDEYDFVVIEAGKIEGNLSKAK